MKVDKLKLLAGLPIKIKNVGNIYPLTLREIAEIGVKKYNSYLNLLCFELEDLKSIGLDDTINKLKNISTFDIIAMNCCYNEKFKNIAIEALSLFFKEEVNFINYKKGHVNLAFFYLGDVKDNRIIHKENFEDIKSVIRQQNLIQSNKDKKEEYNFANEAAKKMYEKIQKSRQKAPKPKSNIDLHSIISSVAWKCGVGINEIWNLTIYQLYDAYYRLNVIDNYDNITSGVYAGTIDGKKIDLRKHHWSNIIKLK